ncbi:MAG: glycosyltransferase family 4 protein [Acidobacteria bacterium]|nr:glycosyltransferase family 4 protein [Acidobacteriota bacterium]
MGVDQKNLRIAINAQVPPGTGAGGIETVLLALTVLSHLDDGAEEYVFVGHWGEPERLRPWLGARGRLVTGPAPALPEETRPARAEMLKRALGPVRPAARYAKQRLRAFASREAPSAPHTVNFFERLGCDVVHFPFQHYEPCGVPSVFNPHDLQHLHHPSFFDAAEIERRESLYPAACRDAHTVIVASDFVRRDVMSRYGIETDKVQVIPWAPPPAPATQADGDIVARTVREKYFPADEPSALYPAMTWEHKNHIRLLEAMALLRDRDGLRVRLVCTGHRTDFFPRIERRLGELRLRDQVSFTGMLSYEELCAVYRAAEFIVIPTLFEAASAPLFEAWQHGAPVACASVTALPEQAGGAALMFDPTSVEAIADAVGRMWADAELREDLRRRGARRVKDFSPERTAKAYRAVYRRAAGLTLGEEDRWLLTHDWTRGGVAAPTRYARTGVRLYA